MTQVPVVNSMAVAPYAVEANRASVEGLIAAYSYAWDSRDAQATAALFTEDASLAFFLNGATEATAASTSREMMLKGMIQRTEMFKRWRIETRHLMVNTVFGPTTDAGEIQTISTAMIYWQQLPDQVAPIAVQTGYYKSWCVQSDDGWLFSRRETHISGVMHPRELYSKPEPQP
jgi:hypothetical protein